MKAGNFFKAVSKKSEFSVNKLLAPIVLTAAAMATMSAGAVNAENIVEQSFAQTAPSASHYTMTGYTAHIPQ
ncbi:hypothetical protein N9W89_00340 [Hellea sp.]|nr:hypothetical protein [Hellea sp.]